VRRVACLLLVGLAGCAPAATLSPDQLSPQPPDQRFVVRAASGEWTIDSLRVERDTLHGSIVALLPSAPRTPLALPLGSVEALREDRATANGFVATLAPLAILLGFMAYFGAAWGSD
jgi:hypothetical protein